MPIRKDEKHRIGAAPWSRVTDHILDLAVSLESLLATIQTGQERNDNNVALFNLGRRAAHEVRRVAPHVESELAEIAWSIRSLHEIDLTLRYLLQGEEHFNEWQAQMLADEKDIVEGFLLSEQVPADQRASWEERLRRVQETSARLGLEMRRRLTTRQLARQTGREAEYDAFFKFLSKFVHPSSWLVNGRAERINADGYRNLLVGLSQVLARRIYGILFEHYRLQDADLLPGARSVPWVAESE